MAERQPEECVDVLICGSGSAGLACALWLAVYNDRHCKQPIQPITYCLLEARDGPLQVGQADGVQCRTVEIFESFGLDHILKNEGYWVNEVSFWATTRAQKSLDGQVNGHDNDFGNMLVRTGRTPDVQPGLSHQPHLILNQARMNGLMLEKIASLKGRDVDYGWKVTNDKQGLSSEDDRRKAWLTALDPRKIPSRCRRCTFTDTTLSQDTNGRRGNGFVLGCNGCLPADKFS